MTEELEPLETSYEFDFDLDNVEFDYDPPDEPAPLPPTDIEHSLDPLVVSEDQIEGQLQVLSQALAQSQLGHPKQTADKASPLGSGLGSGQLERKLTKTSAFHLDQPLAPAPLPPTFPLSSSSSSSGARSSSRPQQQAPVPTGSFSTWADLPEDFVANLHTGRPEEFYASVRYKTKKGTGVLIEDYQLGEKLGDGGMGAVFKGLNVLTGDFAAIKRLPIVDLNEDQLKCLQNEITLLQNLDHENIVKYLGVIKTQRHINLILEYVEGGSLAQVISGYGVFPESLAAIYIQQVLNGLSYLHDTNIIHKAIKASNLLITKQGVIKLSDFGVSHSGSSPSRSSGSAFRGSPFWMAPEVLQSQSVTTSCDIWSIGCTIVELLTGFPPYFDKPADVAAMKMITEDHPVFPHRISPELHSFLTLCFQKDPQRRPSATQLLQHEWVTKSRSTHKHGALGVNRLKGTLHKYNSFYKVSVDGADWKKREGLQDGNPSISTDDLDDLRRYPPPNLHLDETGPSIALDDDHQTSESLPNIAPPVLETETIGRKSTSPASLLREKDKDKASTLGVVTGSSVIPLPTSDEGRRHSTNTTHPVVNENGGGQLAGSVSRKVHSKKKFNLRDLKETEEQLPKETGQYTVTLLGTHLRKNLIFSFTEYNFQVEISGHSWEIVRTYDDFKDLRVKLEKILPNEKIPVLPPSKFFGVMDPEFVKKRGQQLNEFITQLLQIPAVTQSSVFVYFIH